MEISVVMPVYNEEENIEIAVEKVNTVLKKGFNEYEIILVNDGSKDKSKDKIEDAVKKNSSVKGIHFKKNMGQTAATFEGIKFAKGKLIVTMDSDMQTDPEDIYVLLNYINQYDFINGKRATREDGKIRKISSLVGNGVRNFITGDNIQDTGCPLKLFKKECSESFFMINGMHRFMPTLAKIAGYSVIEVPVRHYDRIYGKSKYGVMNRLFKGLKDAFGVRWIKSRYLKIDNMLIEKDVN